MNNIREGSKKVAELERERQGHRSLASWPTKWSEEPSWRQAHIRAGNVQCHLHVQRVTLLFMPRRLCLFHILSYSILEQHSELSCLLLLNQSHCSLMLHFLLLSKPKGHSMSPCFLDWICCHLKVASSYSLPLTVPLFLLVHSASSLTAANQPWLLCWMKPGSVKSSEKSWSVSYNSKQGKSDRGFPQHGSRWLDLLADLRNM